MNDRPPSSSTLAPVGSVLAELLAGRESVAAHMPLRDAIGLVLARDLIVPAPVPPHAIALRPGFAVASADLVGVSPYSPVLLQADPPWLETGDKLPPGLDAILPRGVVERRGAFIEIVASCTPGENVRRAGEDAAAGSCLRRGGEVLRGLDAAIASAAGLSEAAIRPVLLRCVIDSQSEFLAPLLRSIEGALIEIVDGLASLQAGGADLILLLARDAPTRDGPYRRPGLLAGGLALGCAETVTVGHIDGVPILAVSPRLDTVFALLCGLVRPYVDALSRRRSVPAWLSPLSRKLSSTIGLMEIALVRETTGAVEPLSVGTLSLAALAQADGYIVVPPESEGFQIGDMVEVRRVR